MEDIITRSKNKQETPEQKLARKLLKNSPEFRKLMEKNRDKTNEAQRRQYKQDKREMINIIAVLLDQSLSMNERLRRAGRAPANSPLVKEFKNNFIKFAKKHRKLFEKLQKQKKETLKGILNLTLNDFTFNALLNGISNSVGSALGNSNKQNRVNSNEQTVAKNKEQTNKEFEIKDIIRRTPRINRLANLKKHKPLSIKPSRSVGEKQPVKIPSKLNSFAMAQTVETPAMEFNQTAKIGQVEALKKQRMEEALNPKTASIGRTMSPYPPIPTSYK